MAKNTQHKWTQEEIKGLVERWDLMTVAEIATSMNLKREQVIYMANAINRAYPGKLAKKKRASTKDAAIKSALG